MSGGLLDAMLVVFAPMEMISSLGRSLGWILTACRRQEPLTFWSLEWFAKHPWNALIPAAVDDGVGESAFLDAVVQYCAAFGLSVMACFLASLLRLLCFACPLKGGSCNCDPLIRGGRLVTSGAPMRFWVLFLLATASFPVGLAGVDGSSAPEPDWQLHERLRFELQLLEASTTVCPTVESAEHLVPPPFADFQTEVDPELLPAAVQVPVMLLQFQRQERYASFQVMSGSTSEELIDQVTSATLADSGHFHVIEAHPQPDWDVVVLAVIPRWWRSSDMVPVVVDASDVRRGAGLVCIPKQCSFAELREALFVFWPGDAEVVYENRTEPLRATDLFFPTEGSLFRVIPAGHDVPYVHILDQALIDLDWVRDVAHEGLPEVNTGIGRTLVLCPEYSFVLSSGAALTFPQLHRQVAVCLSTPPPAVHLFLPNDQIEAMAYNGRGVASVIAADVDTAFLAGPNHCGLFIDSRDVGIEVSFRFFSTRVLGVDDFVEALDLSVPDGFVAGVDGYAHRAGQQNKFFFHPCAVVTIWLDPDGAFESSGDEDAPGDIPDAADHEDLWTRIHLVRLIPMLERTP